MGMAEALRRGSVSGGWKVHCPIHPDWLQLSKGGETVALRGKLLESEKENVALRLEVCTPCRTGCS